MNPILTTMIMDAGRPSYGYGSYDDRTVMRVALCVLAVITLLVGWAVHERMQWETVSESNVWLRVGAAGDARRFTPALVDDVSGRVYREQIGPKHCDKGPVAMPLGSSVLARIETRRDKRDGRIKHVLDTNDLGMRFC